MEGAVGSGLLETFGGGVHSLSGSGSGGAGQYLDLLHMSDFGAGINDFLSGFEELLSEVAEL